MSSNQQTLLESIEARLTPDLLGKIATTTGETPARTRAAMTAGTLASFSVIAHQAVTREGAANLISRLQAEPAQRVARALEGDVAPQSLMRTGGALAPSLFGSQAEPIKQAISTSSGVSPSAASGMLAMIAPIIASVLGREVMARRLDAGGLSSMLAGEERGLLSRSDIPRAISRLWARTDVSVAQTPVVERAIERVPAPRVERLAPKKRGFPWLLLGAAALAALLLFFAWNSLRGTQVATPSVPAVRTPPVEMPSVKPPELTGANIPAPKPAPLMGLAAEFGGMGPLPDRVALDGVNFDISSAIPTDDSAKEVDEVAAAMKQYPNARIRLEGHTDSTGDMGFNAPLSNARAENIKKQLVDRGIDAGRIETGGRADTQPVGSNDTDNGRSQNRRVDMVILSR